MGEAPKLLFAVGLGRSGTTALWEVLSAHGRIVMGCERYKMLWNRHDIRSLTAEHYRDRERFFDFDDGLTNITPAAAPRWANHYAAMEQRFDRAAYVGDKMTAIRIGTMSRTLPDPHFVAIVRDIWETAASWEIRARNPNDPGWHANYGGLAAVDAWQEATRKILRSQRLHPQNVSVVEHRSLFGDPEGRSLRRLLDVLGLDADDGVLEAFALAHGRYGAVADKARDLPDDVVARILERHDTRLWRRVTRRAL